LDIAVSELDLRAARGLWFQDVVPSRPPNSDDPDERRFLYREERCRWHLYGGDARVKRFDVVRTFDFYTETEWRNSAIYVEQHRPFGGWDNLICPLPAPPGRVRNVIFRRGPDEGVFSDRDRDLMVLLQPHIARALEHRLATNVPDLTPTQWQVLRYLDEGLSTREIAEAMFVSTSTVRKHVENIFSRLGVTNRVAALGRAFGSRATV
jgi:DNA-binding CsgD family transcriptional regulator